MTKPTFTFNGKVTDIPTQLKLDQKTLEFFKTKDAGWSMGGWYKDELGEEYLVKMRGGFSYVEALLSDLATIVFGVELAPQVLVGHADLSGQTQIFIAVKKIENYQDFTALKELKDKKSFAKKLHQFYVFNALIANDDLNEENIGIIINPGSEPYPIIIDYGLKPTFLNPEQIKFAGLPFHLASFIGHRNLNQMQLIRRRYFGHDDFINPIDIRPGSSFANPVDKKEEDINYLEILKYSQIIIAKKDEIIAKIKEYLEKIFSDQALKAEERKLFYEMLRPLDMIMTARIDYLANNFSADIALIDDPEKSAQFEKTKWRDHPLFNELMQKEKEIFFQIAADATSHNVAKILDIVGSPNKESLFSSDIKNSGKLQALQEYAKKNHVLNVAVIAKDTKLVKFLIDNNIADINLSRNLRSHNYHLFRLTPLHAAIAQYHDELFYNPSSYPSCELIDILKEKFLKENGESFDKTKKYDDAFVVEMTYAALKNFELKAHPRSVAATTIQRAFREFSKNQEDKQL